MNDWTRRLLSLLAVAVAIGLMLSAATHASTPMTTRSVIETIDEVADTPLVDSLLDQCRKKPQWTRIWDGTRNRMVWTEKWIDDCKSAR